MALRIDWKMSLIMTAVLLVTLYSLRYVIQDSEVYCMAAILLFALFFLVGNLLFRRR